VIIKDLKDLGSIRKVEEVDIETINKVPKSIIAEEESQDVLNELQSHLSSKKAMIAYKEICDDGIGSHHSIVRNITSLKNYERNFVELRKNSDLISRAVFCKEASINYFVNVGNKVSFHFEKRWVEKKISVFRKVVS
jgi:hypothetical protein